VSQEAAEFGWLSQARGLVSEIRALSKRRVGTLVGLTVGAPDSVPRADLLEFLHSAFPGCEVTLRTQPGPLRVLALEGRR